MENRNRLLTYREAQHLGCRECYIYGFPLDKAGQRALGEKLWPTPSDSTSTEHSGVSGDQFIEIISHLLHECYAVWPSERLNSATGFKDGQKHLVIAVAVCRRRNDDHIPKEEDMVKLKAIFAANGFTEEPQWFLYD